MPNQIIYQGGEWESVHRIGVVIADTSTSSSSHDPAYGRSSIAVDSAAADYAELVFTDSVDSADVLWMHFRIRQQQNPASGGFPAGRPVWALYNGNTPLLALVSTIGGAIGTYRLAIADWSGSAWVPRTDTFGFPSLVASANVDFRITTNEVKVYFNQEIYVTLTGVFSFSNAGRCRLYSCTSNTGNTVAMRYTEIVVTENIPTVNWRIYAEPITGNSGSFTFSGGTYTDVNAANSPDTTFITGDVDGQLGLFTKAGRTVNVGVVKGVSVSYRGRSVTAPSKLTPMLRIGGVNYFGSAKTQDVGFEPDQKIWEINPATTAAWTRAEAFAGSLEYGVRVNT